MLTGKTCFHYREPCSHCRDPVFITDISLQCPCTFLYGTAVKLCSCYYQLNQSNMLFFSSVQSRDAVNSEWSSLFWIDILLPWLAGMGMTILVLKKNGRDLKREIWNDMCCISTPPRVIPLAHSPRTEETQELESIGSEKSCEQSINIIETTDKRTELWS